jgi:hypothetical protein
MPWVPPCKKIIPEEVVGQEAGEQLHGSALKQSSRRRAHRLSRNYRVSESTSIIKIIIRVHEHHLLSIMQKTGFGKRRGMTKQNASRLPGGETHTSRKKRAARTDPHWLSFSTARRRDILRPSHFEQSLKPALPGLPLGVSRRFGAMACVTRSRLA